MRFRMGSQMFSIGDGEGGKRDRGHGGDSFRITFEDGKIVETNDLWRGGTWIETSPPVPIGIKIEHIDPLPEPKPQPPAPRQIIIREKENYTFIFLWEKNGKRLKKSEVTGTLQEMKEKLELASKWVSASGGEVNLYSPSNFKTSSLQQILLWVQNVVPSGVGLPF